jgi:hypothetical protein
MEMLIVVFHPNNKKYQIVPAADFASEVKALIEQTGE